MEKKRTAVEKLELMLLGMVSFDSEELRLKYKKAFEKSKEIEKEQIIDAFKRGTINEMNGIEELNSEQYYNETFKQD